MYQYQTYFDFIHEEITETQGSVPYYLRLFSILDFDLIPRFRSAKGRNGYDNHCMIKIALIAMIERLNTYPAHRRFLRDRPRLCELIGLKLRGGKFMLPSDATFSKFYNSDYFATLIKDLFSTCLRKLLPLLLRKYRYICVDSQPVLANTALNNPKNFSAKKVSRDKDAAWGVKGKSNASKCSKEDVIYYYGYKLHMLSLGPIPLTCLITPANKNDSEYLRELLIHIMDDFSLCSLDVCADKGYDSNKNFDFIHDVFRGRAFIPKRRSASFEIPRGKCGSLLVSHSTYFEKKRAILKTKSVCPLLDGSTTPCPFKSSLGISDYGCTSYTTLTTGKYRDWIDTSSPAFKKVYRHRLNIENLFSIAEDGRLKRINGYSQKHLNTKVALFSLFMVASASLAISIGKNDLLSATVKLKDFIAA